MPLMGLIVGRCFVDLISFRSTVLLNETDWHRRDRFTSSVIWSGRGHPKLEFCGEQLGRFPNQRAGVQIIGAIHHRTGLRRWEAGFERQVIYQRA